MEIEMDCGQFDENRRIQGNDPQSRLHAPIVPLDSAQAQTLAISSAIVGIANARKDLDEATSSMRIIAAHLARDSEKFSNECTLSAERAIYEAAGGIEAEQLIKGEIRVQVDLLTCELEQMQQQARLSYDVVRDIGRGLILRCVLSSMLGGAVGVWLYLALR